MYGIALFVIIIIMTILISMEGVFGIRLCVTSSECKFAQWNYTCNVWDWIWHCLWYMHITTPYYTKSQSRPSMLHKVWFPVYNNILAVCVLTLPAHFTMTVTTQHLTFFKLTSTEECHIHFMIELPGVQGGGRYGTHTLQLSAFRGTVPVFGSKFTAVPLFLYFIHFFSNIIVCYCALIILANFIDFLRMSRFWTQNPLFFRDFVPLLVLDRLVGMETYWYTVQGITTDVICILYMCTCVWYQSAK